MSTSGLSRSNCPTGDASRSASKGWHAAKQAESTIKIDVNEKILFMAGTEKY
jgi:hypothetical protein